ncbi:uncharacterized protein GGS22DRAFT_37526 [Annulohypoxylon maeteangense]|uniref:uncharacterized protein n=1 Tax=Annulohypoxylon maeteangense TaxID=1927788 RepID=UPI0020078E31|nr:uncharacterized protein GGS22DRAFT_37526 [Annulohypoxylon maeteangense]KAI0883218.1 hypothetical protein GGS22DRAFT_37526 [Annulohypoxylon maeteangense]
MSPYSTLEVRGNEGYYPYYSGETNKETIQHDSVYPQLAAFETDRGYLPEVVTHEKVQPPNDLPPTQEQSQQPQPQPQQSTSRIWGLPKRTFCILLVVAIVIIIGALAGGIGGGLAAKQNQTSKDTNSDGSQNGNNGNNNNNNNNNNSTNDNNNNNINILSTSQLTATNRTDLNGHIHRTVFFQDPSSALIARHWDSVNQSWTTANLTSIMSSFSTSPTPLNLGLAPGASLASASLSYGNVSETHIWFVSSGGGDVESTVRSLALPNPDTEPETWQYDDLDGATLAALPGTRLAATWQRCWKPDPSARCFGAWTLAYQDGEGNVRVANGTRWSDTQLVVEARSVARNSSLGLVAQVENGGSTAVCRVILVSESLGSGEVGDMQKMMYTKGSWVSDRSLITSLPAPSPNLQFAMTVQKNFTVQTTMSLLPNGTVTALLWDGHFRPIPSFNFRGGPEVNFTSIAATEDAMIYGFSNDEILQYEPDEDDIYSYVYVGRVYP